MFRFASFITVGHRELREGARRSLNYWLRLAGAAGAALVLNFNIERSLDLSANTGIHLFLSLHAFLLVFICGLVPAMAADSIAIEKREGTLGLLLMTPLSAGGIVLGKALTLAFWAFSMWLAALPVLVIPFLSGGIGWGDVASAVTMQFCLAILCLAAGLLASSLAKSRVSALTAAFGLAALLVFLFAWSLSLFRSGSPGFPGVASRLITGVPNYYAQVVVTPAGVATSGWAPGRPMSAPGGLYVVSPVAGPSTTIVQFQNVGLGWSTLFSRGGAGVSWRLQLLQCWLVTPLVFLLALLFAARAVAATWKDELPSPRKEALLRRYCTPLWRGWMTRRMNRTLDANPIIWLQEYSWKARILKWGPCLLAGLAYVNAIGYNFDRFESVLRKLLVLLAALMTLAGVSSFLAEKRSGALELILVTPLRLNEIIFGRVLGLWKLILPTMVMLVATGFGRLLIETNEPSGVFSDEMASFGADLTMAAVFFLNLPLFSTYFALRHKNPAVAALLTWAVLLSPVLGVYTLITLGSGSSDPRLDSPEFRTAVVGLTFIVNVALFIWGWAGLGERLSRRTYSW